MMYKYKIIFTWFSFTKLLKFKQRFKKNCVRKSSISKLQVSYNMTYIHKDTNEERIQHYLKPQQTLSGFKQIKASTTSFGYTHSL